MGEGGVGHLGLGGHDRPDDEFQADGTDHEDGKVLHDGVGGELADVAAHQGKDQDGQEQYHTVFYVQILSLGIRPSGDGRGEHVRGQRNGDRLIGGHIAEGHQRRCDDEGSGETGKAGADASSNAGEDGDEDGDEHGKAPLSWWRNIG